MIDVDISNNKIIIRGNFESNHFSQLRFYGFQNRNGLFEKESISLDKDILKILGYFNYKQLDYQVSTDVDEIIHVKQAEEKEWNSTLVKAKAIKSGEIQQEDFISFLKFIKTLPRNLREHQIKAGYHLYTIKNGANFSVPGSGKTSVVLSVYEKLRRDGECNVLFVVGPPSSFQPWQNEFKETLGRVPTVRILSGGHSSTRKAEYYSSIENSYELYLTTFHSINNDFSDVIHYFKQKDIKVFLIIDEAHYFKRIGGTWANSLLKVAEYTKFKCVLTGTPIPKSYKDLFNLFDFLWPETSPISDEDRIQIDLWEKKKKNEEVKKLLNDKIGSLFYRVRKKDLKLIPPVFHSPIIIKMNRYEQKVYDFIKSKIHQLSSDDYFENQDLLLKLWKGRMIRLRQVSSYPKLLLSAINNYKEDILETSELSELIENYDSYEITGKLEKLTEIVLRLRDNKEKVLIWSNFIGTLKLIKNHFKKFGLKSELIYGKTPSRKNVRENINDEQTREGIRDTFVDKNSGLDILIANPAACAESISLHKTCYHAIYYDLSYNCAQYLQSLDRIHRVGGSEKNEANYYFLQYENSIDQDIKNNLEQKAQKMYSIIEEDYEIYNLDMFETIEDDDIQAYKRLFSKK